jgi:hypothetical protein
MLERGVAGFCVKPSDIAIKHGLTWPPADVRHGLECLGFVGCWIGLAVVSVMSKSGFWCHSVTISCAVLPLVQETASLGVRVCACRFGSLL